MSGWRERWAGMTLRERRLILLMLALFAIVVLWFGIIRPVADGQARARADHAIALDRNARVVGLVAALKGGGKAPAALDGALDQVVGQSATEAGFTLDSANLEGADRMTIAIGAARAPALFAWLNGLQTRGIGVETLIVQPAAGGTVSARATLRVAR
ncbi:MAG: type II secretion system protein GspM [Pseudomonadota bacterium]